MPNKVYVTNFSNHGYDSAKKYGELRFITKGYVSFKSLDRMRTLIFEGLKDSTPEDWLLISGHGVISAQAILIWFFLHKKVKLLVFDTKTQNRYKKTIITEERLGELIGVQQEFAQN